MLRLWNIWSLWGDQSNLETQVRALTPEGALETAHRQGVCAGCGTDPRYLGCHAQLLPLFRGCTEHRYHEMLEVLPPMAWVSTGFLVSEPWSHRTCDKTGRYAATYQAMVNFLGRYYESTRGLTVAEWRSLDLREALLG